MSGPVDPSDPHPQVRPSWAHSERPVPRRVVRPLQEFLDTSTSGGVVLVAAALVALILANSPWAAAYERFWRSSLSASIGSWELEGSVRSWVNDGLMSLFFLVVGLEIKREFLLGELRDVRAAILPIMAAIGGMVVPAAIYLAINAGGAGAPGWAVAMPTDIAFTLGILALAMRHAPTGLKVFVLGLAIVDDLLTIVVMVVFYRTGFRMAPLILVGVIVVAFSAFVWVGVRATVVFVALAIAMWLAMRAAGVEPALTGVIVAFLTPAIPFQRPHHVSAEAIRVADETMDEPDPPDADAHWWLRLATLSKEAVSPLARVEHRVLPWATFGVLPLFALANAGVHLSFAALPDRILSPVALGVATGHVVGKIVGIGVTVVVAVRLRAARLPRGSTTPQVFSVAAAAGIAFTVSLYVANVAFRGHPGLIAQAKVGILLSGLVAGPLGYLALRATGGGARGRRS